MKHKYLKNVVTLGFLERRCTGCRKCSEVCPHGVFVMKGTKASITDRDLCIECGACVKNCPSKAIFVKTGVGCASAVIYGWLTGTEPSCGCSSDTGAGSCC